MREAALMIASGRADFAPSLADRTIRALRDLLVRVRRRRAAARSLVHLKRLDADRLDDIGLAPEDLAPLGTLVDPLVETRRLARIAHSRTTRDRWSID